MSEEVKTKRDKEELRENPLSEAMSEPKTPAGQETKPVREIDEQTQKHIDRFLQGPEAWNKWANEMLAKKAELLKADKWKVNSDIDAHGRYKTMSADTSIPEIQTWIDETDVDFSSFIFQLQRSTSTKLIEDISSGENLKKKPITLSANNINFSNFIFPGFTDFRNINFQVRTDFSNVEFRDNVDFRGSEFQEEAFFVETECLGGANFSNVNFKGIAVFEGTEFLGEADFFGAVFHCEANFKDVEFYETASFWDVEFIGVANFVNSEFQCEAAFVNSNFQRGTFFWDVSFNGEVDFGKACFQADSSFWKSKFKRECEFSESKFCGKIDFRDIMFLGAVNFINAEFQDIARFRFTSFQEEVTFGKVEFKGDVDFGNVEFFGDANFSMVDFERHVSFTKAKLNKQSNFEAILVKRAFSLAYAEFTTETPNFNQANFAESPRLDNIVVLPAPTYKESAYAIESSKSPSISPLKWQRFWWNLQFLRFLFRSILRLPNKIIQLIKYVCLKYFYGPLIYNPIKHLITSILHGWSKFRNTRRNPDEEAHYRALKRLAIQAHDHENEMKFFAGEIRARRHITDFMWPWKKGIASSARYWAGVFYEAFSDFGRSFIRPIAYWGITFFIFANLTLSNAGLEDKTKCHNSQLTPNQAAYTIGLKNSLLILGLTKTNIVKQAELCLYGLNKNEKAESKQKPYDPKIKRSYQVKSTKGEVIKTDIPFKAVWQGIIHSGLSLLFIFLLLLAIRNQFKIK